MSEKKKRNIIIGTLCGVLLLMAVGYAAFNTLLTINGTASISSNWDIKITNIVSKNGTEGASNVEEPTYEDLTATFSTNLVSPGDSIEYDVTVSNQGSLNAVLEKININKKINKAINITYEGIEAGETLNSGSDITFTIKVEYSDEVTSQPKDTTSTFDMTLDYVEEGKAGEIGTSTTGTLTMGGQTVTTVTQGDGLYEDPVEPDRYIYKGTDPNNYITFNNEQAGWRIISIETDGTIKIRRINYIGNIGFDTQGARTTGYCANTKQGNTWYGCNVWAKTSEFDNNSTTSGGVKGAVDSDSYLKTYLNGNYYNGLTKNKTAIQNHPFYYGPAIYLNDDLAAQIISEKKYSVNSNIGLIQVSDYIKANSDTTSCGTFNLAETKYNTCKLTNWFTPSSGYYWTITPGYDKGSSAFVNTSSVLAVGDDYSTNPIGGVIPTIYLKSDIELSGLGSKTEPYTITNYVD